MERPFSSAPYALILLEVIRMITDTHIPQIFHCHDSESLFSNCMCCDEPVLDSGNEYVIEKAYTSYADYNVSDTVFEYAMCLECMMMLQSQMSQSSLQRVEAYFEQHVDLLERIRTSAHKEVDVYDRLSHCMVKGTPVTNLSEYQVFGLFREDRMLLGPFPYMIGGEAMDEIAQLLSNETIGEIDGFMDTHFGLPPELRKLLLDKPAVLI